MWGQSMSIITKERKSTNMKKWIQNLKVNLVSETTFTVQGHGVHTAFVEMREALQRAGARVFVNSKEKCEIMHIHTIGPYSLFKCLFFKGKKIITAHVVPNSFLGSLIFAKLWHPLAKLYLRYFYNKADAIQAVSPQVAKELKEIGVKKEIFFIPNGVNLQKFKKNENDRKKIRNKLGIKENDFVVLDAGQIQPRKGIETFINTAKELPDVKFIWIGGIPFKRFAADYSKMQKVQQNAPSNILFTGTIPFEDVIPYYSAADILFFPSYQENFPFTVIEAAASNLPLLLRDLDIYPPIYEENYIKGTDENFKSLILKLRDDKELYDEYAEKAYNVAKKYEISILTQELIDIYKRILEKK
ncbi:glycosyltransferase family 1 protein [bacterium CG06_land_8_20_14_3_00_33_50]|nr:MAG: glycosyltransferase family 1 protein [bacterium CG06_land_8_20_14_3_00_33_50]PIY84968.1 MAG: glycosyltransferase family 1 protein [bacterium CG_4_10_14_0_8_um_filter_33_57]PJA72228.1 MAG: glycosyltransferase family 1 protein [bacterium CG_4_9_14_3_um_filter_33_26]